MRTVTKILVGLAAATVLLTGCNGKPEAQSSESKSRQAGYDQLVAAQPGKTMAYSPTRETINFWVETWSEPGKLSFVYLQSATGGILGYYVLEGLPVSMCAAISPTYEERSYNGSPYTVPAPANDGVYYSGGQCNTYYGKDATTGTYVEWTAGMGINTLLFEEPLPNQADVNPLGQTSVEDVKQ